MAHWLGQCSRRASQPRQGEAGKSAGHGKSGKGGMDTIAAQSGWRIRRIFHISGYKNIRHGKSGNGIWQKQLPDKLPDKSSDKLPNKLPDNGIRQPIKANP